eukprot:gnl/MRDRNA2_/MRDRNA2_129985_c0_seq1.p1 gnl/MRDRNA2_/MRDRNA2_129985_c0~~gnl/MRDRNA2_/MRDRNA2_129985_c0_seq1.p1  ORF type:complete len:844 (+),score=164.26 gnl/MRDRNA2_/MRDRNA2_129985_c0_seq1:123-2654(+)
MPLSSGLVVTTAKTYGFIKVTDDSFKPVDSKVKGMADDDPEKGDVFFHKSVVVGGDMLTKGDDVKFKFAWDAKKNKFYCTWVCLSKDVKSADLDDSPDGVDRDSSTGSLKVTAKTSTAWDSFDNLSDGFHRYANKFGYMKTDDEGIRSLGEFLGLDVADEATKLELVKIDVDGNGHIGFAEFALWADQHTVGMNLGIDVADKREWRAALPTTWNAVVPGERIRLCNVDERPHLNDCEAIAEECITATRWSVKLLNCKESDPVVEVSTSEFVVIGAQWEVMLGGEWKPFDKNVHDLLEGAFVRGESSIKCQLGGYPYELNLSRMEQTNPQSKKSRSIRRSGGGYNAQEAIPRKKAPCRQYSRHDPERLEKAHQLLDLAKKSKWDDVFEILQSDPKLVDIRPRPRRYALLHHLAERGPLDRVKRLVEDFSCNRFNLTEDGLTALSVAERARFKMDDKIEYLRNLLFDAKDGAGDVVAEVSKLSGLGKWNQVFALLDQKPDAVTMQASDGNSAFHQAAHHGALDVLRRMVEKYKADPFHLSKDGKTAFQIARARGHAPATEYLGALLPSLVLEDNFVVYPPQQFVRVKDSSLLATFQAILRNSRKLSSNWTRDRGESFSNKYPVPIDFELVGAVRNENVPLWRMYTIHREVAKNECHNDYEGVDAWSVWQPWTAESPNGSTDLSAFNLFSDANEWILFHGSKPSALESIAKTGFSMNRVGTGATWGGVPPLYGYGAYFADCITKADEYAREKVPSGPFEGCRTVALMRVVGGRILYCADDSLPKETLHEKVLAGPHHATIGDRLKLRDTFREYVAYDASSIYLDHILYYKRVYSADDVKRVLPENL